MIANVMPYIEVTNLAKDYFPLKLKILAKRKYESTTKPAILPNSVLAKIVF
jgi:hypothetical protein